MVSFISNFEIVRTNLQSALSVIITARHAKLTDIESRATFEKGMVKISLPNSQQLRNMQAARDALKTQLAGLFPSIVAIRDEEEEGPALVVRPRDPEDVEGMRAWLMAIRDDAAMSVNGQTEYDIAYKVADIYLERISPNATKELDNASSAIYLSNCAYLLASMTLGALDEYETLRRLSQTEYNLRRDLFNKKRNEKEAAERDDVTFASDVAAARRTRDAINAAESELDELQAKNEVDTEANIRSLNKASTELRTNVIDAEESRSRMDSAKLELSQYRQINSVRDQYIDTITAQLKKYNDSQERYLNQLRSVYIALNREVNEPEPHLLDSESDVWKREAAVFTETMHNMMLDFSVKLAKFSEHRSLEIGGVYARSDLHAKITATLSVLHDKLDVMLASISQKPVPVFFNPEQSCIPAPPIRLRPRNTLYCWERATERHVLRDYFRGPGNDGPRDTVSVFCCDNHRNSIRQVREVTVIGYTMTRGKDGKKVWVLQVKNGF